MIGIIDENRTRLKNKSGYFIKNLTTLFSMSSGSIRINQPLHFMHFVIRFFVEELALIFFIRSIGKLSKIDIFF